MAEKWDVRTQRAFEFWQQLLKTWDQSPSTLGHFQALIAHLKRFEQSSADTFQFVTKRGADPVYLLHVLISLCDEDRVTNYVGFPQLVTQEKTGSLEDLRDFHLVTESDLRKMESARSTFQQAGLSIDEAHLQELRRRFDAMPEPPAYEGLIGEKTILWTTFHHEGHAPTSRRGRPGEHWLNTAMVLLARHLEDRTPTPGSRYSSIAVLLNTFCPTTYKDSPLTRDSVRQRVISVRDRTETYCQFFERWFEEWKEALRQNPMPFDPWQS